MIERAKQLIMPILIGAVFIGGLTLMFTGNNNNSEGDGEIGSAVVPALSALGQQGKTLFDANCASCHGQNAFGTAVGPPLVHTIYNPGHHGDEAFFRAAGNGVRAHHWNFGNMPPVATATQEDVTQIIRYVREMQIANGIVAQPHNM